MQSQIGYADFSFRRQSSTFQHPKNAQVRNSKIGALGSRSATIAASKRVAGTSALTKGNPLCFALHNGSFLKSAEGRVVVQRRKKREKRVRESPTVDSLIRSAELRPKDAHCEIYPGTVRELSPALGLAGSFTGRRLASAASSLDAKNPSAGGDSAQ